MYFKGIQLQGFKSFADKTYLEFKGGITAIVGPNGSGKSNISDAIRWVMGETSAKSLRGAKMEDVIFCGSEKRKPVGFAEVTIIMDNSDHSMNIDFNEVSVTRRVYRSGESEYLINKAPCRLKDVHELFMDTGLGRDGYSIIGQGKIDAILSAKSEERRHIFDEAAGITKYRYRKSEAEKKLASTHENLLRVNDIITELEGQVEPLRVQSEKAREFLKLQEQQKNLEVNLWLRQIDDGRAALNAVIGEHTIVKDHILRTEDNIRITEGTIHTVREKIKATDGNTDQSRANMYALRDEITKTEGEIQLIKSASLHAEQDILRLDGEIAQHTARCETLTKLLEGQNATLTALLAQQEHLSEKASAVRQEAETNAATLQSALQTYETAGGEIEEVGRELYETGTKLAANSQYLLSSADRETSLTQSLSEQNEKYTEMQRQIDALRTEITALENETHRRQQETDDSRLALEQAEKAFAQLGVKLRNTENDYKSLSNRKKILEDLDNAFEGYSKSVKSVMNEYKFGCLKNAVIHGPVSALIKTDTKYAAAIEAALGGAVNNIVTGSEEDAKQAIEYLKSSKKGRVTFMPVTSVKGSTLKQQGQSGCAGYVGLASELIRFDGKFSGIMQSLLGKTVVVDHLDNGIAMAKRFGYSFRIATLHGEILNAGGSITGGSMPAAAGSLTRQSEIKELSITLTRMEKEIQEGQSQQNALQKASEKAKNRFTAAQQALWESKQACGEKLTASRHVFHAFEELKKSVGALKSEQETLNIQKNNASALEKELQERRAKLEARQQEILSGHHLSADNIAALRQQQAILVQHTHETELEQNDVAKDIAVAKSRLEEAQQELEQNRTATAEKTAQQETLRSERQLGLSNVSGKLVHMETLKKDIAGMEEAIHILEEQRSQLEAKQDEAENELKEHNATAFRLKGDEGRIEAKRIKLETDVENILARLWDEYELTFSAAEPYRKEIGNVNVAIRELSGIKNKIKALGNINLNAIEDYKTTKERYEFLTTQKKDILDAKAELEKLIEEMTKVMTEMFEENFARLSARFEETFRSLFGGGRAALRLCDPEDILESGVEIEVQPPGKNLQNITLLSGGEKAFTAIALIFSILKISPTHFCIFDEIEAALDDVNVFRFADYLRNLSKRTQFIVITHRKGTMECADTLYGVTMQEKGVTSLLSLDLDKKEA